MVRQPESIVIIGGGLAGLAAGTRILAGGYDGKLILLEKSPTLGGRTGSIDYRGKKLDLGQHMHVSGFDFYRKFITQIGLDDKLRTQSRLDVEFRDNDGLTGRVESNGLPPPFHLLSALYRFPFITFSDKLRLAGPMIPALLFDYEDNSRDLSFGEWLRKKGASERSIDKLWNQIIVPTLNAPVDEVSLRMGMMILKRVLLDRQGGRLGRLDAPMGMIGEAAASFIEDRGGEVRTASPVEDIRLEKEGEHLVRLADGSTVKAGVVLSAVPGHGLKNLLSDSALERFSRPFWHLEWNSIVNIHMMFAERVMEEEFFGYLEGTAGWVFNVSFNGEGAGKHICLTVSDPGELEEMEPEELVERVRRDLASPLPKIASASLEDSVVLYQPRATFKVSPGSASLRPPQNPVHEGFFLAGDWTDTGWPSTMEGATRSGYRAAAEVLDSISD